MSIFYSFTLTHVDKSSNLFKWCPKSDTLAVLLHLQHTIATRKTQAAHSQHVRLVARCQWAVIMAAALWSDFLVRCQTIKADEESGGSAGTEAAVAMTCWVSMGTATSLMGDGWFHCVAFDGHLEFSVSCFRQ